MGVQIVGLGGAIPANRVSNQSLAARVDTTCEWIEARTGIQERRHATAETTTSDLAIAAGRRALDSMVEERPIDLLLLATSTPDRPCPATAPKVATGLGLGAISAADLSAVCTGFLYALHFAAGIIRGGAAHRAMIIGADVFSTILDPTDRTTLPIFGDGAGAIILEAGADDHVVDVETGSDGAFEDLITIRGGGAQAHLDESLPGRDDPYFRMEGRPVFRKAVEHMQGSMQRLLDRNGMQASSLDYLVAHQANIRILQMLGEQLGLRSDQIVVALDRFGNTSAASVPLALADACAQDRIAAGSTVALTAFGGGLTWGSALLRWPAFAARPSIASIG